MATAEATLQGLAGFLRTEFGIDSIDYQWTNEDYELMDGMPSVGRASSSTDHLYVATGFNAWGITNGTAAGMILCGLISGRDNPWAHVFDATRVKPLAGAKSFISENIGTGAELVGGYLKGERRSLNELPVGEAAIVKLNGERTAVFRDEDGVLHRSSAVCTHMGCVLGWNSVDRTWDCSCHGSRFTLDGAVIHGPPTTSLERIPSPDHLVRRDLG